MHGRPANEGSGIAPTGPERLWILVCHLAFMALFCIPALGAVSVTAQLDRSTVMAGETVGFTVTVEGGTPRSAETFPAIPGLTVQYRGHSQNITSVNGRNTFRHLLNYSVTASQAGQYTLPSITVVVDGTSHATRPATLTVTQGDAATAQNRHAFLRLNVPKQDLYVGEIIPIELQLYVVDAENLQAPQLKSDGFVVHKDLEHTRSQAQIGNVIYTVLTFRKSISAAKAGKLTLGPAEMGLVLRMRARPDPNDVFGFFGRFQRQAATVTSPAVEMDVLPLPSPMPTNFSRAIGTFQWSVTASPTNLNAGDPITLRVEVSGRGNLDNLQLPEFDLAGFKTYPPNSSIASNDVLGIEGTKTFEQVILPQNDSVREIPPLVLSYFDPAERVYAQLNHPAVPIQVSRAPGAAQPAVHAGGRGTAEEATERTDIVHIKSEPGPLIALAAPVVQRPWFWALQGLPLAGFLAAAFWRKQRDKLERNPRLRRKIEVERVVKSGLEELRSLATSNQPDAFYALLFRLLQEQLGERLNLPASAITEAVLDEFLPRRGAPPELIERLHALFQTCNQARYAPVRSDSELLSAVTNLEKALADLQQLPD